MRCIYFETDKYYKLPTYKEYHQTKKMHLQTIDSHYDTKSTADKWDLLMKQFTGSLSEEHMPRDIPVETFKNDLDAFKTKRKGTSNSPFNVSLDKCVNYFQEFNFLYNTTDVRYKLTDAAKKDLLKSIHRALGMCETGVNTDFYSALQSHQKEHDWIQNELVKARCETLRLLLTQYGSSDVHVYNKLVQLANNAQLGIPQKEEVLDAHASIYDSIGLTAFFNQHYPAFFATYEKQTEDRLTNHYLSEFSKMLGICSTGWEAGPVTISSDKIGDISRSINACFQGVETENICPKLGDLSDDGINYTLKSKQDVAKIIKGLVAKKLIVDEYRVSLDQVKADRAAYQNLRLKKDVVLDELINLHDVLQRNDPEEIQEKLQQNAVILMSYPELVINRIDSNPAILSSVPRWLRADTRFVDSSLVVLNQQLCYAIAENNEDAIRTLTAQVLNLIQSEYGYVQQLSEPVFKNPLVAAMLVKKNGLLFAYLNDELQKNVTLRSLFEAQVLFGADHSETEIPSGSDMIRWAHFKARQSLPSEYANEPGLALRVENTTLHQSMANFLRIKAFIALLTPGSVLTQQEISACVNDLNPDLLLKIIAYRKRNGLKPLPFFNNDETCKALEKFNQELSVGLTPDWGQDYLSIKRRACEQENLACIRDPFAVKNAVTFLSKADSWFAGFNQYHAYQSNNEKLSAKLMMAARALYDLIITMAKIGLYLAALYYVLPVIYTIVSFYYDQGILIYFFLWLLNKYLNNSLIGTVNDVILQLLLLDFTFFLIIALRICYLIKPLYSALISTFDSLMSILDIITNRFSYFTSKNEYLAETLEETCENTLVRLDGIDEESAQEKSELLRWLLTQVKTEANQAPGHSFKELLNKKHQVSFRGRTHDVSFLEVASTRRAHYGVFKLDEQSDRMGFFSRRTTTEALLTTVEPRSSPI